MIKNEKKLSKEDFSKIIDEFLKKSISIILNTRINPDKNEEIEKSANRNVIFYFLIKYSFLQ